MLFFGRRYKATASGSTVKGVLCRNCGSDYYYPLACTAEGEGMSPYYLDNAGAERRAQQAAHQNLEAKLRGGLAIRCPECGFLQPEMVRLHRRTRWYRWAPWAGGAALAVGLLATLPGVSAFSAFTVLAGAALLALWWALRSTDDPNTVAHLHLPDPSVSWRRSKLEWTIAASPGSQAALAQVIAEVEQRRREVSAPTRRMGVPEQQQAEERRSRRRQFLLAGWAAATLGAGAAILPVLAAREEASAYAAAMGKGGAADLRDVDAYLRRYPQGRHATELQALRDDLAFKEARLAARVDHDPGPASAYLRGQAGARHQDEARKLLADLFAGAEAELVAKAADRKVGGLAKVIAAALARRTDAALPELRVAIAGTSLAEPAARDLKDEAAGIVEACRTSQELKPHCGPGGPATAVITPAPAFTPAAVAGREEVLLGAVASTVQRVAGGPLLTTRRAERGAADADLVLEYRVMPSGSLSTWRRRTVPGGRVQAPEGKPELVGLVRGYELVAFLRTAASRQPLAVVEARPSEKFKYDAPATASTSGVYVALLMSASREAGAALDRALGLEAQPTPTTFGPDGGSK